MRKAPTNVVDGLGKIAGRWAMIIVFDNKVLAGAWIPGQAENILRVTNLTKRLHIPLVWLVNCSGVKLPTRKNSMPTAAAAAPAFIAMPSGRDRVPIAWFQDTTGIDVGDIAEKAELLGLGQSLIYSIIFR